MPLYSIRPAFADRLQAIAAEDHHLRVHTDLASDLVLMRVRDAPVLLETLPEARGSELVGRTRCG